MCSVPAIGCPGTKRGSAAPRCARAAAITFCLVLPASVKTALRRQPAGQGGEERGKLRHRCRQQHEVGVGELAGPVGVDRDGAVDDAERDGGVEIGAAAPDADDGSDPAGGL